MPIEIPENPKDALKKSSEKYAVLVNKGVPRGRCMEFEQPADSVVEEFKTTWSSKSLWEMWAQSYTHQFYLLQWAMQHGSADLKTIVTFAARIGQLPNQTATALRDGEVCAKECGAGAGAASAAVATLHKETRNLPYDVGAFKAGLQPILSAMPEADGESARALRIRKYPQRSGKRETADALRWHAHQ